TFKVRHLSNLVWGTRRKKSSKNQDPSSKEAPRTNNQFNGSLTILVLGIWSLPGAWGWEPGAFATTNLLNKFTHHYFFSCVTAATLASSFLGGTIRKIPPL